MTLMFRFVFCITASLSLLDGAQTFRELDWWEGSIIYQIYPRSFKDTDGDGYGDLKGILEKLDYIKEIGVGAIWIQPFYKSPMADMGYDVADYRAVDPLFGTMDDFKKLMQAIHDRDMKLILDFVPNHTSDQCEWFKLSEQRVEPYTDFYVWKDPKRYNDTHTTYPNNWRSIFGGPGWTWRPTRQQYSYNQFSAKQPDLNFRNPRVKEEMDSILRYWLDMGVDGFRVDATRHVYEAAHFMDEPEVMRTSPSGNDFMTLNHIYTISQPESYELLKSWRVLVDEYAKKDGKTRILSAEDYDMPPGLAKYLGNSTHPGVQIPFYVRTSFMTFRDNAYSVDKWIHNMTETFPKEFYNWALENHDNPRASTRYDPESVDSWNMLSLLMPGVATIYYGSEIGMADIKTRADQRQDPFNGAGTRTDTRDASRSPMLWDDTKNAGFTTAKKPWLPVNANYWRNNVKSQQKDPKSHLNTFKRLVDLRKTPVIRFGDIQTYVPTDWVYMFTRSLDSETVVVLMNIGSETEEICAKDSAPHLPDFMFVHTGSSNSGLKIGDKVKISDSDGMKCVQMRPHAGVVLSTTSDGLLTTYSILLLLLTLCSNALW